MITPSLQLPCVCEYTWRGAGADCRKCLPLALSHTPHLPPPNLPEATLGRAHLWTGHPRECWSALVSSRGVHALLHSQPTPLSLLDSGSPVPLCCPIFPPSEPHSLSHFSARGSSWTFVDVLPQIFAPLSSAVIYQVLQDKEWGMNSEEQDLGSNSGSTTP